VANSLRGIRASWKGDYQYISNILLCRTPSCDSYVVSGTVIIIIQHIGDLYCPRL